MSLWSFDGVELSFNDHICKTESHNITTDILIYTS